MIKPQIFMKQFPHIHSYWVLIEATIYSSIIDSIPS